MDLLQIINHHSDCLFNTIVCNCKNVADSGIVSTELFVLYTDPEELAMELRDGPCLRRPKNGADRPLHFPCSPLPLAVLRRFGRTTAGYVDCLQAAKVPRHWPRMASWTERRPPLRVPAGDLTPITLGKS